MGESKKLDTYLPRLYQVGQSGMLDRVEKRVNRCKAPQKLDFRSIFRPLQKVVQDTIQG